MNSIFHWLDQNNKTCHSHKISKPLMSNLMSHNKSNVLLSTGRRVGLINEQSSLTISYQTPVFHGTYSQHRNKGPTFNTSVCKIIFCSYNWSMDLQSINQSINFRLFMTEMTLPHFLNLSIIQQYNTIMLKEWIIWICTWTNIYQNTYKMPYIQPGLVNVNSLGTCFMIQCVNRATCWKEPNMQMIIMKHNDELGWWYRLKHDKDSRHQLFLMLVKPMTRSSKWANTG